MASPSPFHNPFDPAARFTLPTPQARPEPQRLRKELAWLTWQLSAALRAEVVINLRQTLDWRAQYCRALDEPKTPAEYTRFGLLGEQLVPKGAHTVYNALYAELRETVRTLEATQPHLLRNWLLAMHSVRLGQLCADLGQRGLDALELLRNGWAASRTSQRRHYKKHL